MRKLYATFLIIACTLVSLPCNAQAEWKNAFSKQGEILKTVGRGHCGVTDGVFRSVDAYSCFGTLSGKTIRCLLRLVHLKMPNRYKYGRFPRL
jgi:hypothetical protein